MMIGNPTKSSSEIFALYTHKSSQDNKSKKSILWCKHCKKLGHLKEMCWKIYEKPVDWKPNKDKNDWKNQANSVTKKN